jgi:zinc ribbon protein
MTTTSTTKLICPECQHENEPERVYCHSCGAKLDRSAVAVTKEPVKDTRQRVKKMFDPTRAKIRFLFFKTSKMILGAGVLALVIQMILPPDVPEPTHALVLASQTRIDMENAIMRHQPAQLQFSEDQVNAYLASALKTKQTALNKPLLDFKRALAAFREGACTITQERSVFGLSLYASSGYSVSLNEGKIVTANCGGSIGRMPIHPKLMEFAEIMFADVWSALGPDIKLVSKFNGIEFHDKSAVLTLVGAP